MASSPQLRASDFTTSTANRGVEAREVEIANIHLDNGAQAWSARCAVGERASPTPPSPPSRDRSASYIQVLIQKQRHRREAGTGPRTPRPAPPPDVTTRRKSPAAAVASNKIVCPLEQLQRMLRESGQSDVAGGCEAYGGGCGGCGGGPGGALPVAGCPALALLHHSCGAAAEAVVGAATAQLQGTATRPARQKNNPSTLWQKVNSVAEEFDSADGPERLDVYRLERGVAALSARGAAPTRLERALRRGARPAARLLAELLAAPRLLAALPAALLLAALRTALAPARDAVVGLVQTLSDYALKPVLALTFNALLQPALVCVARSTHALREALRPLALALGDALEPAARLLAATRLVHVERRCGCARVA